MWVFGVVSHRQILHIGEAFLLAWRLWKDRTGLSDKSGACRHRCLAITLRHLLSSIEINSILARTAQSVQRLATGWTVPGSSSGGGWDFSLPSQQTLEHKQLLYNGYRVSSPEGKVAGACTMGTGSLLPKVKRLGHVQWVPGLFSRR